MLLLLMRQIFCDVNKPLVYIIILNWNGYEDTIECIRSVQNNDYSNYCIVVVDNGSEKENFNKLKSWCSDRFSTFISYSKQEAEAGGIDSSENLANIAVAKNRLIFLENNENLGFAAGNNVGLKYVLKNNAPFAMLLNNDTVIEKDSITILMDFLNSHNEYVAATPQIRYFEPNDKIWNCGGKIMWFGNRKYYFAGDNISKVPLSGFRRVSFITGCALLFRPAITGILTERFFFGEEDLDFSFRQKIAKRKMACCFSSIIYHKISVSFKKVDSSVLGSLYIYYLSRLINNRQYSSSFMFIIKIIMNLGYAILLMIFRYKIKPKQIYIMISTLIRELWQRDEIDRDYCLKSLKEGFDHPVSWIK